MIRRLAPYAVAIGGAAAITAVSASGTPYRAGQRRGAALW